MRRIIFFIYGGIAYLVFFVTFLYAIGFVGNLEVPKTIDSGAAGPLAEALVIDIILLGLFAVQHSTMARPWFKKWWTGIVPKQVERSTYVLVASLLLALLFWQWRPMPGLVWNIENTVIQLIFNATAWLGWLIVLAATFMIGHFELFGLCQVYLYLRKKEHTPGRFGTPALYKYIRHPIMLGFIIAFWAAPKMTLGHLVFAVTTTAYIFIALQLEEKTLISIHGEDYKEYRRKVSMLFPIPRKSKK